PDECTRGEEHAGAHDALWTAVLVEVRALVDSPDPDALTRLRGALQDIEARGMARRKSARVIGFLHELERLASGPVEDQAEVEARAKVRARPAALSPPTPRPPTRLSDILPGDPPRWICERLELKAGRPSLFVGYAGVGKTEILQSAALALALGRPIWGC